MFFFNSEAKERIGIYFFSSHIPVDNVYMGFKFIFSLECYIALFLACFVRAKEVSQGEMFSKWFILIVVYIFVIVAA